MSCFVASDFPSMSPAFLARNHEVTKDRSKALQADRYNKKERRRSAALSLTKVGFA
jgi:hypothetical protein